MYEHKYLLYFVARSHEAATKEQQGKSNNHYRSDRRLK